MYAKYSYLKHNWSAVNEIIQLQVFLLLVLSFVCTKSLLAVICKTFDGVKVPIGFCYL